ncbi:MAG TPA: hypothetical protein DCZ71_02940 [Ruminococcus sp.]|nr:hypothetical protein [Ruminococcus sp.]
MKKFLAIGSALALAGLSLTGCGADRHEDGNYSASDNGHVADEGDRREPDVSTRTDYSEDHSAKDHLYDAVDGVRDAGEDIAEGAGDAVGEIIDGLDGEIETSSAAAETAATDTVTTDAT